MTEERTVQQASRTSPRKAGAADTGKSTKAEAVTPEASVVGGELPDIIDHVAMESDVVRAIEDEEENKRQNHTDMQQQQPVGATENSLQDGAMELAINGEVSGPPPPNYAEHHDAPPTTEFQQHMPPPQQHHGDHHEHPHPSNQMNAVPEENKNPNVGAPPAENKEYSTTPTAGVEDKMPYPQGTAQIPLSPYPPASPMHGGHYGGYPPGPPMYSHYSPYPMYPPYTYHPHPYYPPHPGSYPPMYPPPPHAMHMMHAPPHHMGSHPPSQHPQEGKSAPADGQQPGGRPMESPPRAPRFMGHPPQYGAYPPASPLMTSPSPHPGHGMAAPHPPPLPGHPARTPPRATYPQMRPRTDYHRDAGPGAENGDKDPAAAPVAAHGEPQASQHHLMEPHNRHDGSVSHAGTEESSVSEDPAVSLHRVKVYVKSANRTASEEVMARRARKNAQSRARSTRHRERMMEIEAMPESERTEEEQALLTTYESRRGRKNDRSRERALERKEEIERILGKPESKRSRIEIQFLETALSAKQRKNEGDRLRRHRLKLLGIPHKGSRPGITARGPLPDQFQQYPGSDDGLHPSHHSGYYPPPQYMGSPPPYAGYSGHPSPGQSNESAAHAPDGGSAVYSVS